MTPSETRVALRCVCGGHAYTRDELLAMGEPDPEGLGWAEMWRSLIGPFDIYCSEDDEVLLEEEAWEVRGLRHQVHDPSVAGTGQAEQPEEGR